MTKKCNACGRFANAVDGVKCTKCENLFHRACVNIPKDAHMSPAWLCPGCKSQTPRKDNTENPVRGEGADYRLSKNSPTPLDDKSGEILREIKLLHQEMKSFREEFTVLREVVEGYGSRIDSVERRLECLENRTPVIQASPEVSRLLSTIEQLKSDVNDWEQDSLLNDVEVTGVPEAQGENVGHLVRVLAEKLGISCEERDIVSVERVGLRHAPSNGEPSHAPPRSRPLVVRLARRQLRDAFLQAVRVRRHVTTEGLGVAGAPARLYINERLSKHNRMLFFQARREARSRGWRYVWTRGGRVFVRRETGVAPLRVRSEMDLKKIFGGEPSDGTKLEEKISC